MKNQVTFEKTTYESNYTAMNICDVIVDNLKREKLYKKDYMGTKYLECSNIRINGVRINGDCMEFFNNVFNVGFKDLHDVHMKGDDKVIGQSFYMEETAKIYTGDIQSVSFRVGKIEYKFTQEGNEL